jgi:ankyrin repeat protein
LATEAGHLDVVRELVKRGADLFYLDANGYSALQLAQIRNHGKIAEYLFERIGEFFGFGFQKHCIDLDALRKESEKLRQELCKACTENNYDRVLDVLAKSSTTSRDRRDVLGPGKQVFKIY